MVKKHKRLEPIIQFIDSNQVEKFETICKIYLPIIYIDDIIPTCIGCINPDKLNSRKKKEIKLEESKRSKDTYIESEYNLKCIYCKKPMTKIIRSEKKLERSIEKAANRDTWYYTSIYRCKTNRCKTIWVNDEKSVVFNSDNAAQKYISYKGNKIK